MVFLHQSEKALILYYNQFGGINYIIINTPGIAKSVTAYHMLCRGDMDESQRASLTKTYDSVFFFSVFSLGVSEPYFASKCCFVFFFFCKFSAFTTLLIMICSFSGTRGRMHSTLQLHIFNRNSPTVLQFGNVAAVLNNKKVNLGI